METSTPVAWCDVPRWGQVSLKLRSDILWWLVTEHSRSLSFSSQCVSAGLSQGCPLYPTDLEAGEQRWLQVGVKLSFMNSSSMLSLVVLIALLSAKGPPLPSDTWSWPHGGKVVYRPSPLFSRVL